MISSRICDLDTSRRKVRWGIVGPGAIARSFFLASQESTSGCVVAIGTRNPRREDLPNSFPGVVIHDGYDALLSDPAVDAVYIATPHSLHAKWAIEAARRGKHVLCEKPLAVSAEETAAMFEASERAATFLGEAFAYRFHPLTSYILEIVRSGTIGEVQWIRSSFGFAANGLDPRHRLLAPDLAGGAILDVGCYPVSICRLIAGCHLGGRVFEPIEIKAVGKIGSTGVDLFSTALLVFSNETVAEVSCSILSDQENVLRIFGTNGRLEVDNFWRGTGPDGQSFLRHFCHDGRLETLSFYEPGNRYRFQFDAANEAIRTGQTRFSYPAMTQADSIGNAETLEGWRRQMRLGFSASANTTT